MAAEDGQVQEAAKMASEAQVNEEEEEEEDDEETGGGWDDKHMYVILCSLWASEFVFILFQCDSSSAQTCA